MQYSGSSMHTLLGNLNKKLKHYIDNISTQSVDDVVKLLNHNAINIENFSNNHLNYADINEVVQTITAIRLAEANQQDAFNHTITLALNKFVLAINAVVNKHQVLAESENFEFNIKVVDILNVPVKDRIETQSPEVAIEFMQKMVIETNQRSDKALSLMNKKNEEAEKLLQLAKAAKFGVEFQGKKITKESLHQPASDMANELFVFHAAVALAIDVATATRLYSEAMLKEIWSLLNSGKFS